MQAGDEATGRARVRIGTRGSPLALAQAHEVRHRLAAAHDGLAAPDAVEIIVIKTLGDTIVDRTLSAMGGKGLFTKELEQALLDDRIDIAVHSMKDVPTLLPDGLALDCFLPRADPRDAFFAAEGLTLESLPAGAVVGTASLRRQALVLLARPDLRVAPIRGNVDTRLKKVESGTVDATLLAVAGLQRLGRGEMVKIVLSPEIMLPAVAQGAIGIQRRSGDERLEGLLQPLNDAATATRVTAERALLAVLDGSCRTPIAALATLAGDSLSLTALVIRPDGSERHQVTLDAVRSDAAALGAEAGAILKSRAGPDFLAMTLPEQAVR